jgi:hypothetical protein
VSSSSHSDARVTVVIPCYRQARFLPDAVASVCAQIFAPIEIVIVDDGSPDDTAEVAGRLIAAHPDRCISLVRQHNRGLAAARNTGIAAGAGEYVLVLDADDLISPDFVEACVAELDGHPEVSIAYGSLRYFGEVNEFHGQDEYDFVALTARNRFACTAMFRRRAWDQVGGYDERMPAYEDWDFWLGCGELGHLARYVPRPVFYYRKRADTMLADAHRRDQQLKAHIILNHPGLYSREQTEWARGIETGDPAALAIGRERGMPVLGAPPPRARRCGGAFAGARRFAMLAIADEVLAEPALLAAFGGAFTGADDATLVVCGREEQIAALGELVRELDLDCDDGADLLGVVCEDGGDSLHAAATRVDAMLTARSLRLPVALPRYDAARLRAWRSKVGAPDPITVA